jgi:fucose 4-O-acetylase-like acetyltransferase
MARREDIDRAKGLAILLVVFGHLVARADPAHVDWYEPLRRVVYAFHMPFFLYLSGLTASISGVLWRPRATWGDTIKSRISRLLLPFFGMGLLIVFGKLALRPFMLVDHAPDGLLQGMWDLIWHTADSPALSIWYLFVLFTVSMAAMVALDSKAHRLKFLLAFCAAVYVLPLPEYFYADRVGTYAVFFMCGACAAGLGARWEMFMFQRWRLLLALLGVCLGAIICFGANWPEKLILLPVGMLSMPALHGWLRFSPLYFPRVLLALGRYSFMIYLFNTLFIGLTKGILLHFCAWDGANFLPFAMVLMASGILGPVALKQTIFRYLPALDRLTD